MPEGDTIHRAARQLNIAFQGREISEASAPSPRSPIHHRAGELRGRALELAEARGKHLLAHFSGALVVHSHLGMNGRWSITADGRLPSDRPWLLLSCGPRVAAQTGGKLLRLLSESRARSEPALLRLGPDPLRAGFDVEVAAARLRERGAGREVGDALLDQRIVAGIGNAIRNEACFAAGITPWRPVDDLSVEEAERLVRESRRVMQISLAEGRRPRSIYRQTRGGCPRCGGRIEGRGQGEANRTAYWCPRCQT